MDEKKVREEEYLEFPWGIEDTIENLRELKSILQQQVRGANCDGKGAQDAFEVGFDFDRAIEALEKQLPMKPIVVSNTSYNRYQCPRCNDYICKREPICLKCEQPIDWSE